MAKPRARKSRKSGRSNKSKSVAATVRGRVERGGERYWKHSDFDDLPAAAVAMALSRLARERVLMRVAKGVYYRPRETAFGTSIPAASAIVPEAVQNVLHPVGLSAANVLGLSTQNPARPEYSTPAAGSPRALRNAIVHSGRPSSRSSLSTEEGAILETLRERARNSDLPPEKTIRRLRRMLSAEGRFERLARAAADEPPRVRAMLGALGQELNAPEASLNRLRESLNPLSRFDFGPLRALKFAKEWQAK